MAAFRYVTFERKNTRTEIPRAPAGMPFYTIVLPGRNFKGELEASSELFLLECDFETSSITWKNKPKLKEIFLGTYSKIWEVYYKLRRDFSKEKNPFLHWIKVARVMDLESIKDLRALKIQVYKNDPLSVTLYRWKSILNLSAIEREIEVPTGTLRDYKEEGIPVKHRDKVVQYLQEFAREVNRLGTRKKNSLERKDGN